MNDCNLLKNMVEFNEKFRTRKKEDKEKRNTCESVNALYENINS